MDGYYPGGDRKSIFTVYGYSAAELLVQVLKQCGDDLSRENVMAQATRLNNVKLDLLLPGLSVNTSPTDYAPVEQVLPSLVPFLELEDGRTIVASDGTDQISPSADGRGVQATWRRWAPRGGLPGAQPAHRQLLGAGSGHLLAR